MIAATNHFALAALLFGIVWAAIGLEARFNVARKLSAAVIVILLGLAASNTGLVPHSSAVFDFVSDYLVLTAIPLLLFKADIRRIFRVGGKTLAAFGLGAVGSAAGAVTAYHLLAIGVDGHAVAGTIAAGYTGGSMNFVAVSKAVGIDDPTLFSSMLAAESLVGVCYLMLLAAAPSIPWLRNVLRFPAKANDGVAVEPTGSVPFSLSGLAFGMALSLGLVAVSVAIAGALGMVHLAVLLVTALAVAAANLFPRRLGTIPATAEIGMFFMYLFFGAFGAGTDIAALLSTAPVLLLFCATIAGVHGLVVFGLGRLCGLAGPEVVTGSNACLLGPPTAAALAAAQGWRHLITPGLLTGVLGYVIGTFLGVSIAALLAPA